MNAPRRTMTVRSAFAAALALTLLLPAGIAHADDGTGGDASAGETAIVALDPHDPAPLEEENVVEIPEPASVVAEEDTPETDDPVAAAEEEEVLEIAESVPAVADDVPSVQGRTDAPDSEEDGVPQEVGIPEETESSGAAGTTEEAEATEEVVTAEEVPEEAEEPAISDDAPRGVGTDDASAQPEPAIAESAAGVAQPVLPEKPETSLAAAMLPRRTVSGTVIDAAGAPVPAMVTLHTAAGEQQVAADTNGAFSFSDVPVGSYQYQAYYPGRVSAWGDVLLTPESGHRLDIVMSLYSQVSGRVVDINGQGIAGVSVELLFPSGRGTSTGTATDGTYALTDIEPGQGIIQFRGPQGSVFASAWWSGASSSGGATVLDFPATGVTLTNVDAELHAAAVAIGYVLLPDDSPVDRATVEVLDSDGAVVFNGQSDATGRFATTGLPPGDYTVQAFAWLDADQVTRTSAVQSFTMSGQPFNLQPLVLDREAEAPAMPQPVAVDDHYSTPKDTLLQVGAPGVTGNDDRDGLPDDEPMVEGLVTATSHGEVQIRPDGSFVYQPDDDFAGTDTFSYQLYDFAGSSGVLLTPGASSRVATVTITVGEENGENGENGGDGESSDGDGGNGDDGGNGVGDGENGDGGDGGSETDQDGGNGGGDGDGGNGDGNDGVTADGGGSDDGGSNGGNGSGTDSGGGGAENGATGGGSTNGGSNGSGSNGSTTSTTAATIADAGRLAQTGVSNAVLWTLVVGAFLLIDGAVLLLIVRRRNTNQNTWLEP